MNCPNCNREISDIAEKCPLCGAEIKKCNGEEIPKIMVSSEYTADFDCPKCNRLRTVDVSKYMKSEKAVRLRYKCKCGHSYSAILERRQGGQRKETELLGDYMCIRSGHSIVKGRVVVKDVSISGIRFQVGHADASAIQQGSLGASTDISMERKSSAGWTLTVGDEVITEFRLDDEKQTEIKHKGIIRWISGHYVGVQFTDKTTHPALKFYMWN